MREKIRLARKGEKPVAEHWFDDGIQVPKVYLEAPAGFSVFQSDVEQQFFKDHPEIEGIAGAAEKQVFRESEIFSKPGKCGICKSPFTHYSEHIESATHIAAFHSLHDSYATLDTLLQDFRTPPRNLAPIFLPPVVKRKAEMPARIVAMKLAKVESPAKGEDSH